MSPRTQWLVAKERLRQRPAAPTPLSSRGPGRLIPEAGDAGGGRSWAGRWGLLDPAGPETPQPAGSSWPALQPVSCFSVEAPRPGVGRQQCVLASA